MLNLKLQTKPKLRNILNIRLSSILGQDNSSFWKLVNEIETNPLFLKLLYHKREKPLVIIPRKHIQILDFQAHGSKLYDYDVEEQISINPLLFKKIKEMGLPEFKKLFLSRNNYTDLELTGLTCLTLEDIKKIKKILFDIHIQETFQAQGIDNQYVNNFYKHEVVARVNVLKKQLTVEFLNHRRRYIINYDILDKFLNKDEMKDFSPLAKKMDMINMRLNLINKVTSEIIKCQKKYFLTKNKRDLDVLQQNKLAGKLHIHPSIITRAIKNKTIMPPWGGEEPIRDLFISIRNKNKERNIKALSEILQDSSARDTTDENLKNILLQKYSIDISRRTINLLRNKLKRETIQF